MADSISFVTLKCNCLMHSTRPIHQHPPPHDRAITREAAEEWYKSGGGVRFSQLLLPWSITCIFMATSSLFRVGHDNNVKQWATICIQLNEKQDVFHKSSCNRGQIPLNCTSPLWHWSEAGSEWEREIGEPPIKILLNWFAPEFIPRNTFFRLNCWDSQRYLSSSGLHWLAGWLTTAWPAIFGLLYVQFNWPEIGCLHDLSPDWRLSVLWLPRSTNMCPPVYTFTVN